MYDVIFLATIVAFFALCVAYIHACDRIIGPDAEFELGSEADVVEPAKSLEQAA